MRTEIEKADCPDCHAAALFRHESSQRPGFHYWKCEACSGFFGDTHGFPGAAFSDEETNTCPSCNGTAARRIRLDTKKWYWACECGEFRDVDGKIGAPIGAAVQ